MIILIYWSEQSFTGLGSEDRAVFIVRTAGIYFMPVLNQNIGYISIGFDYVVQRVVFLIFWRLRSKKQFVLLWWDVGV